ncbi:alanine--tRNA ligase [Roseibacillus ishigakijimensis]|uniref:Alanine--tRNA ligase n=1 Tax=Roseibacillus ishigakijimensis TaxID=454146 RepID=A0A934RWS1_9BACT|nr:alanine--tRNA ligase [Roseibacillus ishigakijimensis]MBK1835575.1 alanine--tRNA ligase [Roseibacillus ishigakijimensis]
MTSAEIRQSFLDFFQEKQHTIVPSASLLPQSPGLLFTNAGMNQFVPYFLGEQAAPYAPPRATDTQKCIRAGGKHNDLEDVGYDTYHHTLFEMLGNWSFGDYFKKEAIDWAWELLVEKWGFPAQRLYATVYAPSEGDPSHFDQEAYDFWKAKFEAQGLDPAVHIVNGNVKDNFWMMGDTGPCGPCSELHVNLTPEGDPKAGRELVNADSDLCIEIWNLVFIQYNAEPDGTFRDLPAKHVDTGMGFERVVAIMQNTDGFKDFSQKPTNYNTDTFSPYFRKLEELSGKKYLDIYPNTPGADKALLEDAIAFRVIADHIRTLSLSIADGILPGNNGRNYVLRRILRRAVKYGRNLGFTGEKPFLPELVDTLVAQLGGVFPELKAKSETIKATLEREEESFNQTLDRGISLFETAAESRKMVIDYCSEIAWALPTFLKCELPDDKERLANLMLGAVDGDQLTEEKGIRRHENWLIGTFSEFRFRICKTTAANFELDEERLVSLLNDEPELIKRISSSLGEISEKKNELPSKFAFKLYDTFGFPLDLTALLCRERGLTLDEEAVESLMEEQRERARAAQKSETVAALDLKSDATTAFVGFEQDECEATILELHPAGDKLLAITDQTPFYAEMGGQLGDEGEMLHEASDAEYLVSGVKQIGNARGHLVPPQAQLQVGDRVTLRVHSERRRPLEAHHTATHLLHWALHEVVSPDATQQGSLVAPDRLRFDFSSGALTGPQLREVEEKVNATIAAGDSVSWQERPYAEIQQRDDINAFFGDKYGDTVRVVQIGGEPGQLDGYSMELCGGTHVRNTAEIGLFAIKKEEAVASGVRRIEAVCGDSTWEWLREEVEKLDREEKQLAEKLKESNLSLQALGKAAIALPQFPHIMPALLAEAKSDQIIHTFRHYQEHVDQVRATVAEAGKALKKAETAGAAKAADAFLAQVAEEGRLTGNLVEALEGPPNLLQELMNGLKKLHFSHAAFFIVDDGDKLHLGALCGKDAHDAGLGAGNLIKELAGLAGGKGGGKPDMARGAAPQRDKKEEVKAAALAQLNS